MAFVTRVATAVPDHAISQHVASSVVAGSLELEAGRSEALRQLFERAGVERRYSVLPEQALRERRTLSDRMELYRKNAIRLAVRVVRRCLADAEIDVRAVDMIATCSCTGVMLPSLAAVVAERLGLREDTRLIPLTEAGCAGGASILARADEFIRAYPKSNALIVAVELPSVMLQHDDASSDNVVASALFGDGAAAALIEGTSSSGFEIVATRTQLLPGSLGDLGFDLRDGGFHVVLSKRVPSVIAEHAGPAVRKLLSDCGVSAQEIAFYVLHAGGPKVLAAVEEALCVPSERTVVSWDILRNYGNQSSASVLFVLEQTMTRGQRKGYGLLAAFGPGIVMELSLLRGSA